MRQSIIIIIMRISRVARLKAAAKGAAHRGVEKNREFIPTNSQFCEIKLHKYFSLPLMQCSQAQVRQEGRRGTDGSVDPPVGIAQMGPN